MSPHIFISYSRVDAEDFAIKLCDGLVAGPPSIPAWLDKRELKPGQDWDEQIVEAIRTCKSLVFIMTRDSVTGLSVCKNECSRATKYKKPIIPILFHADAEPPLQMENRQYLNFTGDFHTTLAQLRSHLHWLDSPEGQLQALKDRLMDALRALQKTDDPDLSARIGDEITLLYKQIEIQNQVINDPQGTATRVQERIEHGLEIERNPIKPVSREASTKFINPPPGIAPFYFQDRTVETKLIARFLRDDAARLITVVGRAGVGKTAMVCRLLKSLETGNLPDDLEPLQIDGIVYLSENGTHKVNFANLFKDLCRLLPDETANKLDKIYKNPKIGAADKMQKLLLAFSRGLVIILLDNFEDKVDFATRDINDSEIDEALRALLNLEQHSVKVLLTTRIAPRNLALVQPAKQCHIHLDEGLKSPFAENILREMDSDGKLGLSSAPDELLSVARARTLGFPRALEALVAILSADRDTSLKEILDDTQKLLPDDVVEKLVGEAFSRLDASSQMIIQALAIYSLPVSASAVDYLLQPYLPGVNSAPVLSSLVNMQFVRKENKRYFLHPVDREYALHRLEKGQLITNHDNQDPVYTQFALLHRGAEYFRMARKERIDWNSIEDLAPQLAEFELRYAGEDYGTAENILDEIDFNYLNLWGHYRLGAELHERLLGKIKDPALVVNNQNALGMAYSDMGRYQEGLDIKKQTLDIARAQKDLQGEIVCLNNMALDYFDLGQTVEAIHIFNQALPIVRMIGFSSAEEAILNNLGQCYTYLGQADRAIKYHEEVLTIVRKTGNQRSECIAHENMGHAYLIRNNLDKAIFHYHQAIQFADEAKFPQVQNWARWGVALAYLLSNNLKEAQSNIDNAQKYDFPPNNQNVFTLLGLISLSSGDGPSAQKAFLSAIAEADLLLKATKNNYKALDSKGLALCGLVLCENNRDNMENAVRVFKNAREINKDAGYICRLLLQFDEMVKINEKEIITVRAAIKGQT